MLFAYIGISIAIFDVGIAIVTYVSSTEDTLRDEIRIVGSEAKADRTDIRDALLILQGKMEESQNRAYGECIGICMKDVRFHPCHDEWAGRERQGHRPGPDHPGMDRRCPMPVAPSSTS